MFHKFLLIYLLVFLSKYNEASQSCPESTRPHLTRCDKYFRCVLLPSKTYVWVPTQCERGLIYEPSLKICVLPGDNWECNLADDKYEQHNDDNNVYGINNLQYLAEQLGAYSNNNHPTELFLHPTTIKTTSAQPTTTNDGEYVLENNSEISEENIDNLSVEDNNDNYDDFVIVKDENETNIENDVESSGDDSLDGNLEGKDTLTTLTDDNYDKQLSNQLQLLTQLMDNLRKENITQNNTNYNSNKNDYINKNNKELTPAELNSFLANYNIKSQFQKVNFNSPSKTEAPKNDIMNPEHIKEIIAEQNKLNSLLVDNNIYLIRSQKFNNNNNINADKFKQRQQLKQQIENDLQYDPNNNYHDIKQNLNDDFSHYNNKNKKDNEINNGHVSNKKMQHLPYITEDTLKTVIELSKQLVGGTNNNNNKETNYLQPIVHPIYYTIPIPILSNNNNNDYNSKNTKLVNDDKTPNTVSVTAYINNNPISNSNNSPNDQQELSNGQSIFHKNITLSGGDNDTTVIYNNNNKYEHDSADGDLLSNSDKGDQNEKINYNNNNNNNPLFATPYDSKPYQTKISSVYLTSEAPQIAALSDSKLTFNLNDLPLENSNINNKFNNYNKVMTNYPSNNNFIQKPFVNSFSVYEKNPYQEYLDYQPTIQYQKQEAFQNQQSLIPPNYPIHNFNMKPNYIPQYNYQTQISPPTSSVPFYNDYNPLLQQQQQLIPIKHQQIFTSGSKESLSSEDLNQSFLDNADGEDYDSEETNLDVTQFNQNELFLNGDNDKNKLISLGGSIIDYNTYKDTILPLLNADKPLLSNKIAILICASGVRQANKTDCTKYYICNKNAEDVVSYTCPKSTAFNEQSRICDSKTYKQCTQSDIIGETNNKLQMQALQAMIDAKHVQEETVKTQNLANLIRLQTEVINSTINLRQKQQQVLRDPLIVSSRPGLRTTRKPIRRRVSTIQPPTSTAKLTMRKRFLCREPGKIPDARSVTNYYICFKNENGRMMRQKMACSKGLIFCNLTRLCTLKANCNQ